MTIFITTEPPPGWPSCPACHRPAFSLLSTVQAMCGNEDCQVFLWDPTSKDPMANAREVTLTTFGLETAAPPPDDSV